MPCIRFAVRKMKNIARNVNISLRNPWCFPSIHAIMSMKPVIVSSPMVLSPPYWLIVVGWVAVPFTHPYFAGSYSIAVVMLVVPLS